MDAKTREARRAQLRRVDAVLAVVELVAGKRNVAHPCWRDFVDAHRPLVMKSRVEEHELERQPGVAPERAVGTKADIAVLVVIEIEQFLGQVAVGDPLRRAGQRARLRDDVIEAEGGDLPRLRRNEQA